MKDTYLWSKARMNYHEHSIIYSTCGMMSQMGILAYRKEQHEEEKLEDDIEKQCVTADNLFEFLLFANSVDNFNCYLSDVMTEILATDPRPIYGKKFDAKLAFSVDDIASLRSQMVEKQILDMGYQNITDLVDFLEKNFGLVTMSHWLTQLRLNRIIQLRNIVTHNRGIVNATYLFRSKSKSDRLGSLAKVRFPLRTSDYLDTIVDKIDREIVSKFKIGPLYA